MHVAHCIDDGQDAAGQLLLKGTIQWGQQITANRVLPTAWMLSKGTTAKRRAIQMGGTAYLQLCATHHMDDDQNPGGQQSLGEQNASKGQKSVERQIPMGRRCYLQLYAAHLVDDEQTPEGQQST